MKVLHVAAWDTTIYKFRLRLLNALRREGFITHVAAAPTRKSYVNEIRDHGHVFHPVSIKRSILPSSNLSSVFKLFSLIRQENFDIVHTHTPIGGAVGRMAAALARVPIVLYTTGGWYFHENMPTYQYRFFASVERVLAKYTDIIFSVNREDIQTARREHIRPQKHILYSGPAGVELERFPLEFKDKIQQQVRNELKLSQGALVVGLVARLTWEKGLREFLQVASSLKKAGQNGHVKFLLVGDGPQEANVTRLVQQLNVQDMVCLLGWRDDIPRLMMALDLYLFPSHREGVPITVLEAMAAQTPVVAYDIRGCREAVVNGQTGVVVPVGNVAELADAVTKLLNNLELREEFGQAGRKHVAAFYTPELHVERQLAVYRNLPRF